MTFFCMLFWADLTLFYVIDALGLTGIERVPFHLVKPSLFKKDGSRGQSSTWTLPDALNGLGKSMNVIVFSFFFCQSVLVWTGWQISFTDRKSDPMCVFMKYIMYKLFIP